MRRVNLPGASFPQGQNPVDSFIPVARITDMLLNPGASFEFDGVRYVYPDTRLVWWAGGNPFHHHQDLNRMRRAWQRPETVIANEWCWNGLARHADIVLPCTTTLERSDIALTPRDPYIVRMDQAIAPVGAARDDHDILRGIARQLQLEHAFTEGREPEEWLRWIYDQTRTGAAKNGIDLPTLDDLRDTGWHLVAPPKDPHVMLRDFRDDPEANPLATPSGRIEIWSETIAGFNLPDCPAHPSWMEPVEWLGNTDDRHPLHMMSGQPDTKLHSQLDHGSHSRAAKVNGHQTVRLNPDDAAARGISDGDRVRVFNTRGWCLASAELSDALRPGVIRLSTGAWFDPAPDAEGRMGCRHGNPNVLTLDKGTSRLGQGPIAHSCLVEVARDDTPGLDPRPFEPPKIIRR